MERREKRQKGLGGRNQSLGTKVAEEKEMGGKEMGKEKEREGGEVGKGNVVNVHRSGYN